MTPERFQRIEALFHAAAALAPLQRANWLAEACAGDAALRAEVEKMLAADDRPTACEAIVASAVEDWLRPPPPELPPDRLGPYRIVRSIGAGGMGEVFLAERDDDEFQRAVAIKVLRAHTAGPRMADLRRRFARERQILADLDHPSIARLIDGGTDPHGRPYLVLEFVNGVDIVAYCERQRLPLRERCRLFIRVCEAVAFAHRNLVVHRDIKPSNILVTADGFPKLLDFGVAKLLTPDEFGVDLETRTGQALFTLEYAAPEQIRYEAITTATDVYSLGAVLHELAGGRAWFAGANLSMVEMVRRITEGGIPPPAKGAGESPPADLINVICKAMDRQPSRRYSSADRLAGDLQNFLDRRPVEARGNDLGYRAGKFVRRNWPAAAAAVLAVGGLAGGFWAAARQRDIAERRFNEVRMLARHVLFDLEPAIRPLNGSIEARQKLARTAQGYLDRLSREASASDDLQTELAEAYERLADIEGSVTSPSLGNSAVALENYRQALRLRLALLERRPGDSARLRNAAVTHSELGNLLCHAEDSARNDAKALMAAGRAEMDRLVESGAREPADYGRAAEAYWKSCMCEYGSFDMAAADRLSLRAEDLSREWVRADPAAPPRRALASMLSSASRIRRALGDLESAERMILEALAIGESLQAASRDPESVARMQLRLAWLYGETGNIHLERHAEAEALIRRAEPVFRVRVARDGQDARARFQLAQSAITRARLAMHRDPRESLAAFDEAIALVQSLPAGYAGREAFLSLFLTSSTYALRAAGDGVEADRRLARVFAGLPQADPAAGITALSATDAAWRARAWAESRAGQPARAVATLRTLDRKTRADERRDLDAAFERSKLYRQLAAALIEAGDAAGARHTHELRLRLWEYWSGRLPSSSFVQRQLEAARAAPCATRGCDSPVIGYQY